MLLLLVGLGSRSATWVSTRTRVNDSTGSSWESLSRQSRTVVYSNFVISSGGGIRIKITKVWWGPFNRHMIGDLLDAMWNSVNQSKAAYQRLRYIPTHGSLYLVWGVGRVIFSVLQRLEIMQSLLARFQCDRGVVKDWLGHMAKTGIWTSITNSTTILCILIGWTAPLLHGNYKFRISWLYIIPLFNSSIGWIGNWKCVVPT